MAIPFFDLKRQLAEEKGSLLKEFEKVLDSGHFILGKAVSSFEDSFAKFSGTKHAVGVASGTDALHLALRACGIKSGDEVVTTPFTFVATSEAIAYLGATPKFADIDLQSYNIDPAKIEEKITKKTKAILLVHLYGYSAEMDKIIKLGKKHDLKIVEDCAQAMGAEHNGKMVGTIGDAGCFSFFPTKNLGCFGDGGMVTTNSPEIDGNVRMLRGHGSRKTYYYETIGFNSRLDAMQAAFLSSRFEKVRDWISKRRKNATLYNKHLKGVGDIVLPVEKEGYKHTYNQYTIRTKDRNELFEFLRKKEIGCMVYYPLALHLQTAFSPLGHKKGDFKNTETAQDEVLSLPIFPELKKDEIQIIIEAIKEFFRR
jgi:dTDP-4-amino-4,6-dideoxygalactose transaminase